MNDQVMKKPKGFAAMTEERRRELARLGGKRVHELGKAHVFSHEEAIAAGRRRGMIQRGEIEHPKKD